MYSLVSASVIGFDLVRRPGGGAVASLLVDALALKPEDLPLLARARPLALLTGADRQEVAAAAQGASGGSSEGASVGSPMVTAMGETNRLIAAGRVSEALALIESAPMAGLEELLTCVRTDVFDWTWTRAQHGEDRVRSEAAATAVEAVCDALVAAYHGSRLRSGLSEQLVEPWAAAQRLLPRRTLGLGPCEEPLVAILEGVATLEGDGWEQLLAAGRQARLRGGWAPAMHSATLAVDLSGRIREAAAAQLRAVRVLSDRGLSVTDAARGVWNAVSGALQATVALDLLDDESAARLREPVLGVL